VHAAWLALLLLAAQASALDASTYAYPLRVSSNGRYLVDRNGKPFHIQGEAAWSLIANLTLSEANTYLENRRLKGFNLLMVNLIEHHYTNQSPADHNAAGVAPFKKAGDLTTHDDLYFDNPDPTATAANNIIRAASDRGQAVLLAPNYFGADGGREGWWEELGKNGVIGCTDYGAYVGRIYEKFSNIIWLEGGDYTPPAGAARTCAKAIKDAIVAAGAKQPWTGHWSPETQSVDVGSFGGWSLNGVYTYRAPYASCRDAHHATTMPTFLLETAYEHERPGPIRKLAWWAHLGGCTAGTIFGNRPIWLFDKTSTRGNWLRWNHKPTWQEAMEERGSLEMMYLGQAIEAVPWYDLAPSSTVVKSATNVRDEVTVAVAASGRTLVAYVPPSGAARLPAIALDMAALSAPVHGRWYDPSRGTYTPVPGPQPFPNVGVRTFQVPALNAVGESDWVLVLDTTDRRGHEE